MNIRVRVALQGSTKLSMHLWGISSVNARMEIICHLANKFVSHATTPVSNAVDPRLGALSATFP